MPDTESLKSLHTILIDAEKGYETALADAKTPEMKAIFERMSALHAKAHSDVHAILLAKGERPDESGSFLSVVHKTVISIRSAVKGLDRSSLPSFADGDERILGAFDRAIADTGASDPAVGVLRKDREALVAAIAELKAKAA
jgi:uncharacterized protein (TIGR02284 family)